jgi:AP-3 complex subunit sigma
MDAQSSPGGDAAPAWDRFFLGGDSVRIITGEQLHRNCTGVDPSIVCFQLGVYTKAYGLAPGFAWSPIWCICRKLIEMILAIFVFNTHGKARLVRWYDPSLQNLPFRRKKHIVWECYRFVHRRAMDSCNFLGEASEFLSKSFFAASEGKEPNQDPNLSEHGLQGTENEPFVKGAVTSPTARSTVLDKTPKEREITVVFRHYATLFFVFVVDQNENELGVLDLIQVFVETLDKYFGNVCELDIVFNFDRVNYILDELVSGGLVLETSQADILSATYAVSEAAAVETPSYQFLNIGKRSRLWR